MNRIAKAFLLTFSIITLALASSAGAGVLENLDEELTDLVQQAEPYLVTVEATGKDRIQVLVGSGTLISKDGYVITTTSVVGQSETVKVTFKNGDSYDADMVGLDYHLGLALLKIEPVERQAPKFGDPSRLKDGSWIIVIGNSYDMPNAVNFGLFSGLTDEGFLQLSVRSGPGSSGSAVFNTKGEMVGLLVAQATESVSLPIPSDSYAKLKAKSIRPPSFSGLGMDLTGSNTSLAVPVDDLKRVVEQLKTSGEVEHGFLGIRQNSLDRKKQRELAISGGVVVISVTDDSPARKAGLAKGDIIVKFDTVTVKGPEHLYRLVRLHQPDDKIELEVIRDGENKKFTVSLGLAPDDGYFGFRQSPLLGLMDGDVAVLTPDGLTDKIEIIKDRIARLNKNEAIDIKVDIEKLEEKVLELENYLEELADKIDKLSKKMNNK